MSHVSHTRHVSRVSHVSHVSHEQVRSLEEQLNRAEARMSTAETEARRKDSELARVKEDEMRRYLAVCCSIVQGVAVYCSVLQCVAVCCTCQQLRQRHAAKILSVFGTKMMNCRGVLQYISECCSALRMSAVEAEVRCKDSELARIK